MLIMTTRKMAALSGAQPWLPGPQWSGIALGIVHDTSLQHLNNNEMMGGRRGHYIQFPSQRLASAMVQRSAAVHDHEQGHGRLATSLNRLQV
jgi:hypothetical protein